MKILVTIMSYKKWLTWCHTFKQKTFGRLGVNLVVATRKDSYEIIEQLLSISYTSSVLSQDTVTYYLNSPDPKDVINSRCDLMEKVADKCLFGGQEINLK